MSRSFCFVRPNPTITTTTETAKEKVHEWLWFCTAMGKDKIMTDRQNKWVWIVLFTTRFPLSPTRARNSKQNRLQRTQQKSMDKRQMMGSHKGEVGMGRIEMYRSRLQSKIFVSWNDNLPTNWINGDFRDAYQRWWTNDVVLLNSFFHPHFQSV